MHAHQVAHVERALDLALRGDLELMAAHGQAGRSDGFDRASKLHLFRGCCLGCRPGGLDRGFDRQAGVGSHRGTIEREHAEPDAPEYALPASA